MSDLPPIEKRTSGGWAAMSAKCQKQIRALQQSGRGLSGARIAQHDTVAATLVNASAKRIRIPERVSAPILT